MRLVAGTHQVLGHLRVHPGVSGRLDALPREAFGNPPVPGWVLVRLAHARGTNSKDDSRKGRLTLHRAPRATCYIGGCFTIIGSCTKTVEPCPWILSTVGSPPIRRQKGRLMASPTPVPPYLLLV